MAGNTITITSMVSSGLARQVTVDAYGRNPLAEDYAQANPDTYKLALRAAGPPPRMFLDGQADLPLFTASGIDPQLLLRLPYRIRHYAAAMSDPAQVHALFEQYAADPYAHVPHEGLTAAIGRMRDWASGRMDTMPLEDAL